MIRKALIGGVLLCAGLTTLFFARTPTPGKPAVPLVLSCQASVHLAISENAATSTMDGYISLTTLGDKRLAMQFSGQVQTPEGKFLLNRILMTEYRYYPENHALELSYRYSNTSSSDNMPDAIFYQRLLKRHDWLLYLTRFNSSSWLVSGLNMPLYLCTDH